MTINVYNTIPKEFWPKCAWCGEDLGDCTVEVKTNQGNKRKICSECEEIISAVVNSCAAYSIGKLLKENCDIDDDRIRLVGIDEIEAEAIQKMRNS